MSELSVEADAYLRSTEIIDWHDPVVQARAAALSKAGDVLATARACFEFVRDEIKHSRDFELGPATCRASDVLRYGTGYCYAKSHLLAALLRANEIPAGLCYQRLSVNDTGPPYCLHGYNAVLLPQFGWFRMDARGNKTGVDARFDPPVERLAFSLNSADEADFENIFAEPLGCVVGALTESGSWREVLDRLPDVSPERFGELGIVVRARGGND